MQLKEDRTGLGEELRLGFCSLRMSGKTAAPSAFIRWPGDGSGGETREICARGFNKQIVEISVE